MYVHNKRKLIYLAHPRTGSTATAIALQKLGFARRGTHHSGLVERRETGSVRTVVTASLDTYDGWEVFSVVRNHFDAIASWHAALADTSLAELPPIDQQTVERIVGLSDGHIRDHELWYHAHQANAVLRYEHLQQELEAFLGQPIELGNENASKRRRGTGYRDLYEPSGRAYVAGRFCQEMTTYGYTF